MKVALFVMSDGALEIECAAFLFQEDWLIEERMWGGGLMGKWGIWEEKGPS